jgi:hypothetical protein
VSVILAVIMRTLLALDVIIWLMMSEFLCLFWLCRLQGCWSRLTQPLSEEANKAASLAVCTLVPAS